MEGGYAFVPCGPRLFTRSISADSTASLESGRIERAAIHDSSQSARTPRKTSPQTLSWLLVRMCWLCALPLWTACIVLIFACVEITKSGSELGHSHGLSLVALARIGRAISEVHSETKEVVEALSYKLNPMSRTFIKIFCGARLSTLACGLAVCSSMVECFRDPNFGGHHGLVILSLADLVHALRAMPAFRGAVLILGPMLSMGMTTAAIVCAGLELFVDLRPGAHHGVAILALAHMAENVRRLRHRHAVTAKAS